MASSHVVTTKATMTTAATAASIHHQAEIGRHVGLASSRGCWPLGFMGDIISRLKCPWRASTLVGCMRAEARLPDD